MRALKKEVFSNLLREVIEFVGDLRWYFCWLLGHQFKFEPTEGDTPPFEFSHCQHCGKPNSTFFGGQL